MRKSLFSRLFIPLLRGLAIAPYVGHRPEVVRGEAISLCGSTRIPLRGYRFVDRYPAQSKLVHGSNESARFWIASLSVVEQQWVGLRVVPGSICSQTRLVSPISGGHGAVHHQCESGFARKPAVEAYTQPGEPIAGPRTLLQLGCVDGVLGGAAWLWPGGTQRKPSGVVQVAQSFAHFFTDDSWCFYFGEILQGSDRFRSSNLR